MLVRGRRLDPRRILRYLFQELIAPWIQIKRLWLRIIWFFTTPIYIGPMWTTSVVCGLIGVMLTILLFKPPGRLEASTKPIAVAPAPPTFLFAPQVPEPTTPAPLAIDLDGRLVRTMLAHEWDQIRHTTLVSTSLGLSPQSILQPIRDGWSMAQRRLTETWPTVYRQTAPLWNPVAQAPAVQPADQPLSYGGAGESHPALIVTRDLPAESPPSEAITYALIVQNRGAEILEQILVTEELANLDRVESTHPPADVSATALHWRIDSLRPGQERRLAITLQPGTDREIQAVAEVRAAVAVSSSTHVTAVTPLTVNETPPVLMETPKLAPVEPASREVAPKVARLSVVAEIPTSLKVDDELSTVFVVSNTGNGDADGVVLTVDVPAGLEHRDGVLVEHRYAHIPAGTTKRAIFKVLARTPSMARIDAVLTHAGTRVADWTTQVQIIAKPVASPAPLPSTVASPSTINPSIANPNGPVPEDGPALRSRGFDSATAPMTGSLPGSSAPAISGQGASIPAGTGIPQPGLPVDSTIPRNRRPIIEAPQSPSGQSPLPQSPSGGSIPGSTIPPAGTAPAPGSPPMKSSPADPRDASVPKPAAKPGEQPDSLDDTNYVNVPRRQGASGLPGWKRIMNR
ncbi:hypothetical protein Pan44_24200 [Caulifigura coniformis]|uniref:DUF11 domain-containing protein n=1 Tax=Caulifigura coniformis TaxID=2527983 RepID=A0A517SE58_9PLAN|nr:hypothetical protein [Caulifigura coniformis]QDT54387.1 hypothetical protein Pan44_24200 [Caulifigura coniformis]